MLLSSLTEMQCVSQELYLPCTFGLNLLLETVAQLRHNAKTRFHKL